MAFGLFWMLGAAFLMVRLVIAHARLLTIKRSAEPILHPVIDSAITAMYSRGLRRRVVFAESAAVTVPMLAGVVHPVVLMPKGLSKEMTDNELEAIAVHEMAHLLRRDDVTKLLQKVLEAVFFFHPAIRFIGRELELLREIACDDWVVAHTRNAPAYARCLTRLVRLTSWSGASLAPGALLSRKQIFARFDRLLNRRIMVDTGFSRRSFALLVTVVVGTVLTAASFAPALTLPGEPITLTEKQMESERTDAARGSSWAHEPPPPFPPTYSYTYTYTAPECNSSSPHATVSVNRDRRTVDHTTDVTATPYSNRGRNRVRTELQFLEQSQAETARAAEQIARRQARERSVQQAQIAEECRLHAHAQAEERAQLARVAASAPRVHSRDGSWFSDLFDGSRYVNVSSNDNELSATWSTDDRKIKIRAYGEIEFTDDERGIASLGDDGYLLIKERHRGDRRELEAEADGDGSINYRYWVDGRKQPFDDEARDWLADVIPTVLRNTGLGAEARVKRLYEKDRVEAIVREISLMESDYVRSLYVRHLADQQDLSSDEVLQVFDVIDTELDSDFERANALGALSSSVRQHPERLEEYVRAIQGIDSDFEMRRALQYLQLDKQLPDEVVLAVLRAAEDMDSDFERTELLLEIAPHCLDATELGEAYLRAADGIDSDFELRRTLCAVAISGELAPESLRRLIEFSTSLESDYEKAQFLLSIARRSGLTDDIFREMILAATTLDSDFEKRRTLSALPLKELESADVYTAVIRAIDDVGSDFEKAELMLQLATTATVDNERTRQYVRATDDIESDFEKGRVLATLIDRTELSDQQVLDILETTIGIHSDFEKAQLLSRLVGRAAQSESLEDPFLDAVESIHSSSERDRLYSRYMRTKRASR
jgi:hypothetical protein